MSFLTPSKTFSSTFVHLNHTLFIIFFFLVHHCGDNFDENFDKIAIIGNHTKERQQCSCIKQSRSSYNGLQLLTRFDSLTRNMFTDNPQNSHAIQVYFLVIFTLCSCRILSTFNSFSMFIFSFTTNICDTIQIHSYTFQQYKQLEYEF